MTELDYETLDTPARQERIKALKASAPEEAIFEGFGGSAIAFETLVWYYKGKEFRIPVFPEIFDPHDVAYEYGCISRADW